MSLSLAGPFAFLALALWLPLCCLNWTKPKNLLLVRSPHIFVSKVSPVARTVSHACGRRRGVQVIVPPVVRSRRVALRSALYYQVRHILDYPLEIGGGDRMVVHIGRGVEPVDCIGDTVADRELACIHVVAEGGCQG